MRRVTLIVLVLLVAVPLFAGTIRIDFGAPITITTTAAQDAKLTRALADYNAARTQAGQGTVTMEAFLRDMIVAGVKQFTDQAQQNEQAEACAAYAAATQNVRNQIDAALGGKSPCR